MTFEKIRSVLAAEPTGRGGGRLETSAAARTQQTHRVKRGQFPEKFVASLRFLPPTGEREKCDKASGVRFKHLGSS